jgi:hypothetical protein
MTLKLARFSEAELVLLERDATAERLSTVQRK